MKLAIRMDVDGSLSDFDLDAGYEALGAAVGGYFECVHLATDLDMWVNEEGLFLPEEDYNKVASDLMKKVYGKGYMRGPVVFTGTVDAAGDTLGLSAGVAATLRETIPVAVLVLADAEPEPFPTTLFQVFDGQGNLVAEG